MRFISWIFKLRSEKKLWAGPTAKVVKTFVLIQMFVWYRNLFSSNWYCEDYSKCRLKVIWNGERGIQLIVKITMLHLISIILVHHRRECRVCFFSLWRVWFRFTDRESRLSRQHLCDWLMQELLYLMINGDALLRTSSEVVIQFIIC